MKGVRPIVFAVCVLVVCAGDGQVGFAAVWEVAGNWLADVR